MLTPREPTTSDTFIGRQRERTKLEKIAAQGESAIVVCYGRRRVGKTSLIEKVYAKRNLIKIEGAEGLSEKQQLAIAQQQLAMYVSDSSFKFITFTTWLELFQYLYESMKQGTWTLYFEELQWLAGQGDNEKPSSFIAQFKIAWDNYFRHNQKLVVVLCGSSPSFMIKQVVHSKALYNRSLHEIHLQPFTLQETASFFPTHVSKQEKVDAHLLVGGIPEYLNQLRNKSSIYLSVCEASFKKDSFFSNEYQRIFTSSLSSNPVYRKLIQSLAHKSIQTRTELLQSVALRSGGAASELLETLQLCGFIESYAPYHVSQTGKSRVYAIADNYLHFYYRFIEPEAKRIAAGAYEEQPSSALSKAQVDQYLGYAFERYCRQNHHLLAKILGFSAVSYSSGAYFERKNAAKGKGYQWDLVFDRADKVLTVCEIKYTNSPVGTAVIDEFERRLATTPFAKKYTINRVLLSAQGATKALHDRAYFDTIIDYDDLV